MDTFNKRVLVVGLAVMAAVAAGGAYATIPDSAGVIHTCYSKATGTWRPIDYPGEKCKSGEMQLDFNQRGPQGPSGTAGPGRASRPGWPSGICWPCWPSRACRVERDEHGFLCTFEQCRPRRDEDGDLQDVASGELRALRAR